MRAPPVLVLFVMLSLWVATSQIDENASVNALLLLKLLFMLVIEIYRRIDIENF
ncbi:MAG: hypothetical protein ACTSRD_10360 [Promethearchaeota archaeon]